MHFLLAAGTPSALTSNAENLIRYPVAPEVLIVIAVYLLLVVGWFAHQFALKSEEGAHKTGLDLLSEFSAFLVGGTLVAQIWTHLHHASYHHYMHKVLAHVEVGPLSINITGHFLTNEGFMAFFFMIASIELCQEILLKKGSLYKAKAILPVGGTLGGVVGPYIVFRYLVITQTDAWMVPMATDIAFAWMGARIIWGRKHPAVIFLLALAIVDDFIGMGIIAVKLSHGEPHWAGGVLFAAAIVLGAIMRGLSRRLKAFHAWQPYLMICGPLSWTGLYLLGLHSALSLVFVVPFVPMRAWGDDKSSADDGAFVHQHDAHDPMNQLKHTFEPLVNTGLFLFGLANAGVIWYGLKGVWTPDSTAVFAALGIGKVVGISSFTLATFAIFKLVYHLMGKKFTWPTNEYGQTMKVSDLPKIGLLASVGFTVALFVVDAGGFENDLRLGALASIAYLFLALTYHLLETALMSLLGPDSIDLDLKQIDGAII